MDKQLELNIMSELYPIKFKPIYKEKVWGGERLKNILNKTGATNKTGESWEISGEGDSISIVQNGFLAGNGLHEIIEIYMGDLVGERVFGRFGTQFPLLFKFIDANDLLSVQVHPDDEMAQKINQLNGKTEIWYVIDGSPDAYVYTGFNQPMTKEKFRKHIEQGTVKEVLNREKASRGNVFYVPAGRIHATGPGVLFAEIQQSSDLTYRVFDWNRPGQDGKLRELHVEQALEALDFRKQTEFRTDYFQNKNQVNEIQSTPYFVLNKLIIDEPYQAEYNKTDSFVVYMCVGGEIEIQCENGKSERLSKGETILIPAVFELVKIIPHEEAEILEIYLPEA